MAHCTMRRLPSHSKIEAPPKQHAHPAAYIHLQKQRHVSRVERYLCGFDRRLNVALRLSFQPPHAEDTLHFVHQAAVAHEGAPALVGEVRVDVRIANGLRSV